MRQQPLHPVELRTGLFISRPVGIDLQLDIPRIEFRDKRPLTHAVPLRHGHAEHLPRNLEGEVYRVVGRGETGEILIEILGMGGDDDLDGTHLPHGRGGAAAGSRERCGKEQ